MTKECDAPRRPSATTSQDRGCEGQAEQPVARAPKSTPFWRQVRALAPAVAPGQRGRLIFALDATMSRQPTWDTACQLQAEMFQEAAAIGGLDVQLVYFRGLAECRASRLGVAAGAARRADGADRLPRRPHPDRQGARAMPARRPRQRKVQALVYVGDAMEEPIDDLCAAAGELGLLGVPAFMFQEGDDAIAEQAFREIARLTRGAYCRFAPGAAQELAELLRAAAAYAAGGMKALVGSVRAPAAAARRSCSSR